MDKYYYEFERVNDYCYPGSFVLKNKLHIQDGDTLNGLERELTSTRMQQALEFPIKGNFDLNHLCSIHRFLFSDIYEWAGKLRNVNIAKGNQFCNCRHLVQYSDGIFERLHKEEYLYKTPDDEYPSRFSYYFSEINVLHPFREGNGRTQRVFAEYLARMAGQTLDFSDVTAKEMIAASAQAFALEYDALNQLFKRILSPITPEEQADFCTKIGIKRPKK